MTEQQQIWFDKLAEKRKKFAEESQDLDYKGIWEVLIKGIYSEDAHFIYELLQNAEDVKATSVKFVLKSYGLYFIHNGTIPFTVTDINNPNEYGHINAITAVGRTGKKISETIGKFGIGFKAVFQYTKTPHIYDPNFQFKIHDYIVPELLENSNIDIEYNKEDNTVFYFPFISEEEKIDNNKVKSKAEAYKDISVKLKDLDKPTLFLSNLKEIIWEIGEESNTYKKEITQTKTNKQIKYDKIKLSPDNAEFLIFTRFHREEVNGVNLDYRYSVGFKIEERKLKPIKDSCAYCFFTTTQKTNLNFLFHAPFLLNSNREAIPENQNLKLEDDNNNEQIVKENFNEILINQLAQLAADSLLILKELKLINDDIVEIIPYKEPEEDDLFKPFYKKIKEKFETEELLPGKNGTYAKKTNAYWATVPKIAELFSDKQLADIIGDNEKNKWVFTSKGRDEVQRGNKDLAEYIDSITNIWLDEKDILTGWSYQNGNKKDGITSDFIEKQNDEWLVSFYKWIVDTEGRKKLAKNKPFFLNQTRKAVPVFEDDDKLVLFLPDNDGKGYETLSADLFKKTSTILAAADKGKGKTKQQPNKENISIAKQFYEKFGIREHTVADEIEEAIERFENEDLNAESFFAKTFKYFKDECPQNEIDDFIGKIEDLSFIPYYSEENGFSYGSTLFYPTNKLVEFYKTKLNTKFVDIKFLQKKYTKEEHKTLDEFLKKLGVNDKDPDLKDEVYNIILPKYEAKAKISIKEHCKYLKTLLEYYKKCSNDETEYYLNSLNQFGFLLYKTTFEPENKDIGKPQDLYYPSDELQKYFEPKPDTKFVNLEDYYTFIIDEKDQQILKKFLLKLGVSVLPRIFKKEITDWSIKEKLNLSKSTYGYNYRNTTIDRVIDGCNEVLTKIDSNKSSLLWRYLGKLPNSEYSKGDHKFFSYSQYYQSFESTTLTRLKKKKWLLSNNGQFVSPNEITINELADGYECNLELERLLGFRPTVVLTETERIAQKFESEEEAEEARKALEEKRENEKRKAERKTSGTNTEVDTDDLEGAIESLENLSESVAKPKTEKGKPIELPDFDEDEELSKGIEDLKKQLEIKKSRVDLAESIYNSVKYSYEWFKAYLQLLTTYGEKQDSQKQKSISFQEIKPYKSDYKYFLLCGASSYISPEIENADDFIVSLVFGNSKRENITVEGVSKKGQDLLIYCREPLSSNTLSRLSNIFKVEINFTPVIDLLDRLYKAFTNDNYIDEWQDIQEAIPSLNFIYGPPGTGKTTTLCNKIKDILAENPNAKFLVLTPTNKASDVVCKKLQDINSNIYAVRLSRPTDSELEESGIYVDSLDNKSLHNINVVTSTIHRLPYFEINGEKDGENFEYKLFKHRNFDYVIFDEASMTGLHYITFAIMTLFKTNPNTNFIVAGDPKQIPPIIEINDKELESFDFQDESIYKMMNLESFNPKEQTIREIDTIQNLDTQYRSIPQIGQLFSELSYSSLLKHNRATNRKEAKPLPEKFNNVISSSVTFVDIPLNQDNSIFKVNKLFYSSYHTYCAILVAEIIKYFDSVNKSEQWTIGLIAPYKAQAILLNKLITSYGISENVKVYSDTVHGFQGDECDIVFFICNPNNYFYSGHEKALLSKEYIYNVAISRAKDYLIVLHPYTAISNPYINKIGISYKNNFGNTKILKACEIEKLLYNDKNYIENNSYVSGHDNVNVFGLSEMKYFIKANDTAIDIQLRDITANNQDNRVTKEKTFQTEPTKIEGVKVVGKIDLSKFEKHKK